MGPLSFVYKKEEALDPSLEQAIQEQIAICLEAKKEELDPTSLHSISSQLEGMRQVLDKQLREYYRSFLAGYNLFSASLQLDPEKLSQMQDPEYVQKGFDEGKTVHQLMGISHDVLTKLYEAACNLYIAQDYKKAKIAFCFLTYLTPWMQQFWLALGQTQSKLEEYDEAINTLLYAISLDEANIDSYLACIETLIHIHDFEKAKQLCEQGITYARSQREAPWSGDLESKLEDAKEYLVTHAGHASA